MLIRNILFLLIFPSLVIAEGDVIGYLELPISKKINVERSGEARPVKVGKQQWEVWHQSEKSSLELRKFDVFDKPDSSSKKVASISAHGAMMELLTKSNPGKFSSKSVDEQRDYEAGMRKVFVFERNGDWLKVKFREHPPWKGRFGWVKLGPNSGGYVSQNPSIYSSGHKP